MTITKKFDGTCFRCKYFASKFTGSGETDYFCNIGNSRRGPFGVVIGGSDHDEPKACDRYDDTPDHREFTF